VVPEVKKCLLLFWDGIGDLINLTPALRELHHHGYHTDVLVRKHVYDSGVFEACPYADLIPLDIGSIAAGGTRGRNAREISLAEFEKRKGAYDGHWVFRGQAPTGRGALRAMYYEETVKAMSLTPTVKVSPTAVYGPPEVWIPEECELEAARFVEKKYPEGFIFKRTFARSHGLHRFRGAEEWIARELPSLPVFDQDAYHTMHGFWSNINTLFAIAKKASHIVLYSSVMVHACEAMGATMDIVNYGMEASKHWPEDPNAIKVIRIHTIDTTTRMPLSAPEYSSDGGKTWWLNTKDDFNTSEYSLSGRLK